MSSTVLGKITKREVKLFTGVLVFALILMGFAILMIPGLKTHYSLSQFLPKDHPLLKADLETRKKFFLDETQPILLTLDLAQGDWLETMRLEHLHTATERFTQHPGVVKAFSLATMQVASDGADLAVGNLLQIKSVTERRARVAVDKVLNPLLISADLKRTLVVVSITKEISVNEINALINEMRTTFARELPEAAISVGGVPVIQSTLTTLVQKELAHFMGLALLASCLTLLLVFSSFWSALVPFAAIIIANVFVLAFMSWAQISMTVLAVTIPILVSVTVLSLCAHTLLRFVEDAHKFEGTIKYPRFSAKASLALATLRSLFMPNLLTSLTTCFGFATLLMTSVPIIREFGIAVSASVMISWVSTTLVLLPLMTLLPIPTARRWVLNEASWVGLVFTYRRSVIVSVLVLCATMGIVGRNLYWSARLFDDLPQKEEARVATENIDKSLGGTVPFEILIDASGTTDPWNDPTALKKIDQVLANLRERSEVGSAIGLTDLLRQAVGNPIATIPQTRSAIAESWFLLSMSENSPLKQFLTSDGSTARLALRLRDLPSDQVQTAMSSIIKEVASVFPDASVSSGGMATTVHVLNDELSRSLMTGFWEALGVITILLLVVFRSWRWTLTAVLPNLVPAAVLVGVLALTKTPIKPGVALVFSIALGIAFNNTVYLLQRLRELMRSTGNNAGTQIEETLRLEGNPCLISSLCVLAGFAIFLASEFGINRTFGTYMLISLFFGLIGDLVFLPALIRTFPGILGSTRKPPSINLDTHDKEKTEMPYESEDKSYLPRAAASITLLLTATFLTTTAYAAQDAASILKNVELRMNTKDESAQIKMKVVESNGSSKERELVIMRKSGDKNQVLVRLKKPTDMNGIALLSVSAAGNEDQWIYMPSQKKARRVVSGNKSQKFLDTEFALEDFSAGTYARFINTVIKEERAPSAAVAVVESKAKDASTSYSKILTWVDLASYQVQKSEYYDQGGKLLKTMVFRDYKKFGDTWRAQTIEVRNMQNQRSTVLQLASLKVNAGINDREFTQSALEDQD